MADGPDSVSAATRLLKAVAGELRDLAVDTARFGESLSATHNNPDKDASIRLLQKFDLFTQSLQAHAVLIDNLSSHLKTGKINADELDGLLHHVPFFSVRERLRAVVTGESTQPKYEETPDDFWFLNE